MVFKPFTHLARQSFGKFTHGYAQSLVAASQASYTPSTSSFGQLGTHSASRFGKAGPPQIHNAFYNSSGTSSQGNKAGPAGTGVNADSGLAAYYAAWQQSHDGDKEWKQFQFAPRIEWKASLTGKEAKGKAREDVAYGQEDVDQSRLNVGRAYSASAIDDIKVVEDQTAEATALARVDAEIAREIVGSKERAFITDTERLAASEAAAAAGTTQDYSTVRAATSPAPDSVLISPSSSLDSSSISVGTSGTSISDSQSQAYTAQLNKLRDEHRYAEIPAVFEAMLLSGNTPTTSAYSALLAAAVELPTAKHHVVPKALDVYADMLHRKVRPDTEIYTTLLELLARRALDVTSMQKFLQQKRLRFGGMGGTGKFMLKSNEVENDILAEDDSLNIAMKVFEASTLGHSDRFFSNETYSLLIAACAERERIQEMIRVYSHMESSKISPDAYVFAPMITAFAAAGDLSSAVECYNEYKALAVADNAGNYSLHNRKDESVYAAVVKAYAICGKGQGALKFFTKLQESYRSTSPTGKPRVTDLQDVVVLDAFISECLDKRSFHGALQWIGESPLSPAVRNKALEQICMAAADNGDASAATEAFEQISTQGERMAAANSMLALHARQGDVESATPFWSILRMGEANATSSSIEPSTMFAVALIHDNRAEEGLAEVRRMFRAIRASASATMKEELEESIEFIFRSLIAKDIVPSILASVELMQMMVDNGGFIAPIAQHLLHGIGPESFQQLDSGGLTLVLQVQAKLIVEGRPRVDASNASRFIHSLECVLVSGTPIDQETTELIERCLAKLGGLNVLPKHSDVLHRWHLSRNPPFTTPSHVTGRPASLMSADPYEETFDPHSSSTDFKGSALIVDELEKGSNRFHNSHVDEALMRFRNIRRAGRHPRYVVYAKLISAAARENRADLANDILAMARSDVPLLPQYRVVRHGWVSILDAMVGACLTLGKRDLALQYHQELLDMGAAPSANTFGLYITTLKESAKTFDEATEAVKIFHRAKGEGVEPSSFLYNALIGKLGKARRIDDCLFYFAEMRGLGIRPTSVTYGTIVNALCRVSDEKFAEELFEEMESMPNYKPRPAPYNSMMQFFLTTKRDKDKVLAYFDRMMSRKIQPTMHTYKLLVDTHATLEPVDMRAAENVLGTMRRSGMHPEAVHYASLVHANGCVMHDMEAAHKIFDDALADRRVQPQACLFQALLEAMVANHRVLDTEGVLEQMKRRRIAMTPYIANTLIHGWTLEKEIGKAKGVYEAIGSAKREPSTYEAMTRAFLAVEDKEAAHQVVQEMSSRGYPSAVSGKILELVRGGSGFAGNASTPYSPI